MPPDPSPRLLDPSAPLRGTRDVRSALVMGAGPGGLAAALHLARSGVRVSVLEAAPFVGGLARTVARDGYRFDLGGHRWFTKNEGLNAWFRDLMGDEIVLVSRVSRIYFGGKFFAYPISVGNVLSNAGLWRCVEAGLSYAAAQARYGLLRKRVVSMEDAFVMQFGRVLYEMFFRHYSEKVWGRPCSEMSSDWVAQRTKGLSMLATVREALLRPREKVVSLIDEFMYPRLGYARISERMAEEVAARGGTVRLSRPVVRVSHAGGRVVSVRARDRDGREEEHAADAFVSSIPLSLLVEIVDPPAPAGVLAAARSLTFRDLVTVNLMLDRERVTGDTWLYVHDDEIPFARIHEPKNWSAEMAPPGKTSLVLEVFCTAGDERWRAPDEEIVAACVDALAHRLGFIRERDVIGAFTVRARQAYPVYALGYAEPLALIKEYLRSFENLEMIGRGGTFRYNNADHSIETGLLAAQNLLGADLDVDSVNADQEYLEEKRIRTGRGA